jgi:hypothetical protein
MMYAACCHAVGRPEHVGGAAEGHQPFGAGVPAACQVGTVFEQLSRRGWAAKGVGGVVGCQVGMHHCMCYLCLHGITVDRPLGCAWIRLMQEPTGAVLCCAVLCCALM